MASGGFIKCGKGGGITCEMINGKTHDFGTVYLEGINESEMTRRKCTSWKVMTLCVVGG